MNLVVPSRPRVLILVQNLSVPIDRRVWLESQALRTAGYQVDVICPRATGEQYEEVLEGVAIHRYDPPRQAASTAGFAVEFVYCWAATARRAFRIRRQSRIDVIQACNPPDTYWLLARLIRDAQFVFDQHDLNPELFRSRFGDARTALQRAQYAALRWLERMSYRTADHVVVPNESYADVARRRGQLPADRVTVVRSGPDTSRMRPVRWNPTTSTGVLASVPLDRRIVAYLGVMGPQDGVDQLLHVMAILIHEMHRTDVHAVLMGFGDCLDELKHLARTLDIDDHVTFTGLADAAMIAEVLSAAEVGLGPDPLSPLNDVSTMNKTMEYMAYALPVVSFDLTETRRSAGDTGVFVRPGDLHGFARAVAELLDDPGMRVRLGVEARRRASTQLDWAPQARAYVSVFDRLLGVERPAEDSWPHVDRRRAGGQRPTNLVDLRDRRSLAEFVAERQKRSQATSR